MGSMEFDFVYRGDPLTLRVSGHGVRVSAGLGGQRPIVVNCRDESATLAAGQSAEFPGGPEPAGPARGGAARGAGPAGARAVVGVAGRTIPAADQAGRSRFRRRMASRPSPASTAATAVD